MTKYIVHFREPLYVPVDVIEYNKYDEKLTQETFHNVELDYDPTLMSPATSGFPQYRKYDFPDEWFTLHMPNNGTKLKLHHSMIKYVEIVDEAHIY